MTDDARRSVEDSSDRELTLDERVGRLQGIKQHLQVLDRTGFDFLSLPNIYGLDPAVRSPFAIPETFISEEVGGSITILDSEEGESLAQENINQMLQNFLPGGYKRRWGSFYLWRGAWHHDTEFGHADVGPMFEWSDSTPLTEILGPVEDVAYTELEFDPDDVTVYTPRAMNVERLSNDDPDYVWVVDKGIVWTGSPPGTTRALSSDPTTNYLWFKHAVDDFEESTTPVTDSKLVSGYRFYDDHRFMRCYYASLLTLYPRKSTRVESGIMRYQEEGDGRTAFIGSKERSQLLTFELERPTLRDAIEDVLESDQHLRRDLQFAFLHALVWEELFFQEEALDHTYQVRPLVEHLLGVDFWQRVDQGNDDGVFPLSGSKLVRAVERLLPSETSTRLRLLGHDSAENSAILEILNSHTEEVARILALCRNDDLLLDFAEDAVVHSAEHALSGWANKLTGSGTAFELWYDVNFQANEADSARIAVYDPIQGGAGIAKEVSRRLDERTEIGVDSGLAEQGRCHSAMADRATIDLLGQYPDGSLYDVHRNNRPQFRELVEGTINGLVSDPDAYSVEDLHSHVDQRVQLLFETRELARFYSYIAAEYSAVESELGRTPRPPDLALHLDRHVFRDPSIRATYERFASDSGRRDIAELGERLEELTVQCVTACPDCLKTDGDVCVRGASQQEATLNRRLLTEVFSGR
ncbi:hypothetical protein [Candidatus Halobonum tyrrellensis]|uniref:hypothetical protein n=1 Tax=Candidatus Halobonum tyrrellensis TaxID=1431545 RepID=UPI000677B086|nr:hypothetical protein [Candidatus Halobonum tyrrellensis]